MHQAEEYLRNPANPSSLYVRYKGKRRHLFINDRNGVIGIIAPRKRNRGTVFNDWNGIEQVFGTPTQEEKENTTRRLIRKYQREASKADFTNPFIRKIMNADFNKGLYENGITTGTRIDGQIITLEAVRKWCGEGEYAAFCRAVQTRTTYQSSRFNFRGYDGSLWVEVYPEDDGYHQAGDMNAGFSKEFRDCWNGYYYLLINERTFIGYDVD